MLKWLTSLIGDSNEREIKRLQPAVQEINALESEYEQLTDDELRGKTEEFKNRLGDGESIDDLLPEAFAAVREASKRTIGLRHFDVQLMGGIVLHQGKIAEMKTGEGKTLVATLPAYLNALTGKGVHIVTVNDYLAKRDPQWMGPIYHRLGVSVAAIQAVGSVHATQGVSYLFDPTATSDDPRLASLRPVDRGQAYRADIIYGTNNEFGFDYLRDNMVVDLGHKVQRDLHYAIVDEVDNILVDEARTPLIISAPAEKPTNTYYKFAQLVRRLRAGEDYTVDEKVRAVTLTETGILKMERLLGLANIYDPDHYDLTHYMENALKAEVIFKRDKDYVVRDGQVVIVDEFTGRLMFGRRYSEGLHQAIEAKEGMEIQRESITWATITFQNYFRMYEKLAGMTGTAVTEAEEFHKIYKLDVVVVPTHRPMVRQDHPDQVYKTEEAKFRAVVREVEELHQHGRPVLIGTTSIEKSERLSDLLLQRGVRHQVLNAKLHEKEATIIAQAGHFGAVTVATNMAGRGVDIILGGNPPDPAEHARVRELGGLHIVGTERHEARRIDNQLRGRAGRQGDPGSSRFYLSLEDDIMRRFGGDRIKGFMEWAGLEEDVPIEHGLITKSIENAQTKVEGHNFDIRKHVVDYDDVMNKQREVIYGERHKVLSGADLKANILDMIRGELEAAVAGHLTDEHGDSWDVPGLLTAVNAIMPLPPDSTPDELAKLSREEIQSKLLAWAEELYEQREREMTPSGMRLLERLVMLRIMDRLWVEHLTAMDDLREGIGLRAYGQTDPLVAYKREAHVMFDNLLGRIQRDIVHTIYHVAISKEPVKPAPTGVRLGPSGNGSGRAAQPARQPVRAGAAKVGRNDPCPCGSGKKYKKCHGREA